MCFKCSRTCLLLRLLKPKRIYSKATCRTGLNIADLECRDGLQYGPGTAKCQELKPGQDACLPGPVARCMGCKAASELGCYSFRTCAGRECCRDLLELETREERASTASGALRGAPLSGVAVPTFGVARFCFPASAGSACHCALRVK